MQTIAEVQAACDALAVLMAEKGVLRPEGMFFIKSHNGDPVTLLKLGKPGTKWDYDTEHFPSLAEAEAFVRALPSPEERHRNEFLTLAGKAADYAAAHLVDDPIAAEVRASIVAGMKRLSENALTAA